MMQPTTVGVMNYNVLRNILVTGGVLKLNRGAEIGVLYGDTSFYLLKELPGLFLYSVDPYIEYSEGQADRTQNTLSKYEECARGRMKIFGPRSQFIKDFSVPAAQLVEDNSLDFVFIDANHEYKHVKEDINAWYPKVRKDGIISGHDYRWGGVKQAVEEFGAEIKADGFFTPQESDIWFFVKPT